uniref:Uncharacterized protein n=1 Tax=Chromera velia CCMP2878 TaxID=1169474 RepID=A0A0G4GU97_9ALVE|eukprot:Cvel_5222.t1-p1 / transcript=Cvel_5222.t1 / gene=Cvel_5222 / organism=Chromera_velia_CCMP2878 / gene_product=hypothetical protein / transcript_product=hypothetical protein / location=Cvel_scaffold240:101111-103207(-) / protein_length=146 / sequence_SO=supercontig / SO=protein_coding / is_pseudo=false
MGKISRKEKKDLDRLGILAPQVVEVMPREEKVQKVEEPDDIDIVLQEVGEQALPGDTDGEVTEESKDEVQEIDVHPLGGRGPQEVSGDGVVILDEVKDGEVSFDPVCVDSSGGRVSATRGVREGSRGSKTPPQGVARSGLTPPPSA